jgi:hypothetical protein
MILQLLLGMSGGAALTVSGAKRERTRRWAVAIGNRRVKIARAEGRLFRSPR